MTHIAEIERALKNNPRLNKELEEKLLHLEAKENKVIAMNKEADYLKNNGKEEFHSTDLGNAERFSRDLKENFIYVPEIKNWMFYDGKKWSEDIAETIILELKKSIRKAHKEELKNGNMHAVKWLTQCESHSKIKSTLALMPSHGMTVSLTEFDKDDYLLNVQNGTVDLKTGKLKPHNKADYLTKICNFKYNPNAKSVRFETFLNEIMLEDKENIDYLQKLFGYCCTGSIKHQELYNLKGSGGNGKSILLEVVKNCLGDYAVESSPDILLTRNGNFIPNDVARLNKARLVKMSEPDPNKHYSDNAVKQLTGGDMILARYLHKEFFEFKMKAKMMVLTNHEIKVIGTDNGMWRRQVVIPFDYSVPDSKRDLDLEDKLTTEGEGILSWMIEGCLKWQNEGLEQPENIKKAKEDYRNSQDAIGQFLEDCCYKLAGVATAKSEVYLKYQEWCKANGEYEVTQKAFSSKMSEKGFVETRATGGKRCWNNITLTESPEEKIF